MSEVRFFHVFARYFLILWQLSLKFVPHQLFFEEELHFNDFELFLSKPKAFSI